jgi:hypothetical protein
VEERHDGIAGIART